MVELERGNNSPGQETLILNGNGNIMETHILKTATNSALNMLSSSLLLLLLCGMVISEFSLVILNNPELSLILLITGINFILFSIMFISLSSSKTTKTDVCEAISMPNIDNISNILSSLLIDSKGVYAPVNNSDNIKVFIPLESSTDVEGIDSQELVEDVKTFNFGEHNLKRIVLTPPGYGLYLHVIDQGVRFTASGIENEIKDILVNYLEIASKADVAIEGNRVYVKMSNLAYGAMCTTIRENEPDICTKIGCPICSFVGCAIVAGLGKQVVIENVCPEKKSIYVTFLLIGE